jgi:DNA-binding response OmpR family regulator
MDEQRVLIVEDELALQELLQEALKEAGFAVTVIANGDEAIGHLQDNGQAYAALVSDIQLSQSGTTGWDVARAARELNSALPVVYTTGGAADEWAVNGVPNSVLVTKPFAPAQIVTAVSQLLNMGGPTPS